MLIPRQLKAGVTNRFSVKSCKYPASDGWQLVLLLRGPAVIDLTATASGQAHVFDINNAESAAWVAGDYAYSLRALKTGYVFEVETGTLSILPDLTNASAGYDGRSQVKIALDAIEAVLAKRATKDQERYTINNRELWRTPIPELLKLLQFYRNEYARELRAKHGLSKFGPTVRVRS